MMKTFFSVLLAVLFAFTISTPGIFAKERRARTIDSGILNGKAINLPKPEYPASARDVRAGGIVAVNVVIDETGGVVFAEAELNDQHVRPKKRRSIASARPS